MSRVNKKGIWQTVFITGCMGCLVGMTIWLFARYTMVIAPRLPIAVMYSAAAAIPMLFIVFLLDEYEIEPLWCTAMAGFGGATAAFSSGLVLSILVSPVVGEAVKLAGRWASHVDTHVLSSAIGEEAAKGLVIAALYWSVRRDLDAPVDAIVYSLMVAIGFAFSENVLNLSTDDKMPLDGVAIVAIMALRYFSHIAFTGLTGAGLALEMDDGFRINLPLWFIFAVILHYFWDVGPRTGWYVFGARVFPFVALLALATARFIRHEAKVITEYGGDCRLIQRYVEGEQEEFADIPTRLEILAELLTRPWDRECRMRNIHFQAVSRLAFLRRNIKRKVARLDAATRDREAALRETIKATQANARSRAAGQG